MVLNVCWLVSHKTEYLIHYLASHILQYFYYNTGFDDPKVSAHDPSVEKQWFKAWIYIFRSTINITFAMTREKSFVWKDGRNRKDCAKFRFVVFGTFRLKQSRDATTDHVSVQMSALVRSLFFSQIYLKG